MATDIKLRFFMTLVFLIVASTCLAKEKKVHRYALVVGNNSYRESPLTNAVNDAKSISSHLKEIGFSVTTLLDVKGADLKSQIESFYKLLANRQSENQLALFYYAGHALQINHRNYLVPLDVKSDAYENILDSIYDINHLFEQIPDSPNMNSIIILDSCRDNPYGVFRDKNGSPLIADGLAPLRAPIGTIIAYATEPGNVAYDGGGKNGMFTKHLLLHMAEKISVEELLKKVRQGVTEETGNRQTPWEHSSLLEEIFINPPRNRDLPELMTF